MGANLVVNHKWSESGFAIFQYQKRNNELVCEASSNSLSPDDENIVSICELKIKSKWFD